MWGVEKFNGDVRSDIDRGVKGDGFNFVHNVFDIQFNTEIA